MTRTEANSIGIEEQEMGSKSRALPSLVERAVLGSISEGLIFNDTTGAVGMVNRAAARLLHVEVEQVLGQQVETLFQSFSSRSRATIMETMKRFYTDPYSPDPTASGEPPLIELGTRMIQTQISPVLTEIGEFLGIVTVLRDITREVEAEQAKMDFVSNVSHELRTPLTSIKGYSDLLLSDKVGALSEQQLHFIKIIQSSSDRLTTLINDLLDISRIESGRLELQRQLVRMDQILYEVVEMVKPQCAEKNLELGLDLQPDVGPVMGDEGRLAQIVANLVSNACRYTPDGGSIKLALATTGNAVRVDVVDTGIGIAPEDQAKIFQRFHRVDNPAVQQVTGSGLGLSIARMLIEMHGGRMWFESEVGKGSTFTFTLPLYAGSSDAGAVETETRDTILVVDDEENIVDLLALQLRFEGFDVLTAATGGEALQLARTKHIDLITLDMMLPDITGMEVLRQLKADSRTAEIPVVIVSVIAPQSNDGPGDADDHIRKPFALEQLVGSVRNSLENVKRRRDRA
jgi:signal transduction histidine kinase/CheY-like chemotaxis protein